MKQVLQWLGSGTTEVAEVPYPSVGPGHVLIRTSRTLVSAGTERMLVEFGRAGLIGKARQQPERVRQVFDKVRTDGIGPTLDTVLDRLDQPVPLGYSNVGTILEVGRKVTGFAPGDRVVSNGKHAEVVAVPANLCAHVPDAVSSDSAAFTVIGAIALQGIRLANPTLGEAVVVIGLGVVGLLAVQLLRANGCRVLGIDFDPHKLRLAAKCGAEVVDLSMGHDPVAAALQFSRGRGVDAVIVSATSKSSEPIHQAALMSRKRGRIVLVGVTGLEISRADFYEKELTFQVSCSYGPGRYDPVYEEMGQDYPFGFVRWTEQRNFEAVLDMIASERLDVGPLISHRFPVEASAQAYELLSSGDPALGILLEYAGKEHSVGAADRTVDLAPATSRASAVAGVGVIGAGSYATSVLLPALKETGARLVSVASSAGVSGLHAARKYGFEKTTTDLSSIFEDPSANAVVIATRHDSHADLVCRALEARKHVFVEKPLALNLEELIRIEKAREAAIAAGFVPIVMVGFNRRFSPHIVRINSLLSSMPSTGRAFIMTVNAGALPSDHWSRSADTGGGRIIGEACHFIDLLRFLAGTPITNFAVNDMAGEGGDTAAINLRFENGSVGTIHYLANGSKSFPKERLEVFCGGRVLQLDNFKRLSGYGWPNFRSMALWRQDKGQRACIAAFVKTVQMGGSEPIKFAELLEVSRLAVEISGAIRP